MQFPRIEDIIDDEKVLIIYFYDGSEWVNGYLLQLSLFSPEKSDQGCEEWLDMIDQRKVLFSEVWGNELIYPLSDYLRLFGSAFEWLVQDIGEFVLTGEELMIDQGREAGILEALVSFELLLDDVFVGETADHESRCEILELSHCTVVWYWHIIIKTGFYLLFYRITMAIRDIKPILYRFDIGSAFDDWLYDNT